MAEFEQIYKAYFHDVFLYVRSLSKNESVAEEVTSEAFFKALRSIDRFRGDCDIRVWLCQIAKNCFYSYLKKHPDAVSIDEIGDAGLPAPQPSVEEQTVVREDVMQIHFALHSLDEPYREVFMLRVFGELAFGQIGRLFGKTENWACVTYHRAKNKIMKKMEDDHREKRM